MARQEGIIPFTGSLGGLSFYYDKRTGYRVRTKGGFYGKPVKTAPEYARTRENSIEFGCAARSAKLLRTALHELLVNTADNRLINRLNAQMIRIVKTDTLHERGKRTVSHGTCELLRGFEFNTQAAFTDTWRATATISHDAKSFEVIITLNAIANMLGKHPQGATHFRIGSLAVAVNFTTLMAKTYKPDARAEMIALSMLPFIPSSRSHHPDPRDATHIIVALNIEFFQHSNGIMLPLSDARYQAGTIAEVYSVTHNTATASEGFVQANQRPATGDQQPGTWNIE